jgi:uncharacterized membrane protein YGL010W
MESLKVIFILLIAKSLERAPALLDNVFFIFEAPFFFIFEVLFLTIGYRQKELKEWNKVVALEITEFRKTK